MPGLLKLPSFPHKYTTFTRATTTTTTTTTIFAGFSMPANTKKAHYFINRFKVTLPKSSAVINHQYIYKQQLKPLIGFPGPIFWGSSVSSSMGRNKEEEWIKCNFSSSNSPPPLPDHHNKMSPSSKLLTLPTILTIARVASVPVLVCTFYVDSWWGAPATTCIFIAAAITDWLDGYLARRMKLGTAFGAFLDPVADKLMVAATLVLLCTRPIEAGIFGEAPWLLPIPAITIIGREITMSAVREWAASQGSKVSEAVAVNNLGKWKTATQMIALTIMLGTRSSSMVGTGALVGSGVVLLYISAWLGVWSLGVYVRKIWKVLLM